jgi:23S rRNA pseudouridine1911/1915/1917 synthase
VKQSFTITDEDGVVRIDKHLSTRFPEYSRAALSKLFDLNLIKKDGTPLKPGEKVRPGSVVEYDLGPLQASSEVIELPILYEDKNVIVVGKPVGVISHARGRFWQEASVASFIRSRVSGLEGVRGGIVHRLDRATSGVMICAKNESTLSFLQRQFHDRKVQKTYVAVVKGHLEHAQATISAPIKRNENDPKRFMVHPDGKSAETDYRVVRTSGLYSLCELKPKTGRTHQLRLHMKHIGAPIVGDDLYGGEPASRMMLHASQLEITLPDHEIHKFSSILPKELSDYVD